MNWFLLTWKPENKPGYWSTLDLVRKAVVPFEERGFVDLDWRTVSHSKMNIGDGVFILKQGKSKGPIGIFARGVVLEKPSLGEYGRHQVRIKIKDLIDPSHNFFINSEDSNRILGSKTDARASGRTISEQEAQALNKIIDAYSTPPAKILDQVNSAWSNAELEAAIRAYFLMLEYNAAGILYKKSSINRRLREGDLRNRSRASIEYRMQNISAVLDKYGVEFLEGYLPARNIGNKAENRILSIIMSHGYFEKPYVVFPKIYSPRSHSLNNQREQNILDKPKGNQTPATYLTFARTYKRDPKVVEWVQREAKGVCEGCKLPAPFKDINGHPFLEVHHVVWLSQGGRDTVENAVALCPNCHRRLHFSQDGKDYMNELYKTILRLKRSDTP